MQFHTIKIYFFSVKFYWHFCLSSGSTLAQWGWIFSKDETLGIVPVITVTLLSVRTPVPTFTLRDWYAFCITNPVHTCAKCVSILCIKPCYCIQCNLTFLLCADEEFFSQYMILRRYVPLWTVRHECSYCNFYRELQTLEKWIECERM